MAGLHAAAKEARRYTETQPPDSKPHKLAFYADNTGAIQRIFEGSPGKAQAHSRAFRREICNILNADDKTIVAISWCPRHMGIVSNEVADKLAKSGSTLLPERPKYKTQAYVARLHKQELAEMWKLRRSNPPNPPSTWFQPANRIPPRLKPMERFLSTDQKTFSRLMQCRTGHAHMGEYYRRFVPTQDIECPCGVQIQMRQHITLDCKLHRQHQNILGYGRHAQWGRLIGTLKGIDKMIEFIKCSKAFDKSATTQTNNPPDHRRGAGMRQATTD